MKIVQGLDNLLKEKKEDSPNIILCTFDSISQQHILIPVKFLMGADIHVQVILDIDYYLKVTFTPKNICDQFSTLVFSSRIYKSSNQEKIQFTLELYEKAEEIKKFFHDESLNLLL